MCTQYYSAHLPHYDLLARAVILHEAGLRGMVSLTRYVIYLQSQEAKAQKNTRFPRSQAHVQRPSGTQAPAE